MAVRTKHDAEKVLSDIEGDQRFFCNDGCILGNLQQLAECLAHINDYSYGYHVSSEKNDFSKWIRDVLGDDKLARDISRAQNHIEAAEIVKARLAWIQNKAKK